MVFYRVYPQYVLLCCMHHRLSLFIKMPPFNHCHVLSVLFCSVSFRSLPWRGFSSHWLAFFSFERFLNASWSSTSDNPFSPTTNLKIHSSLYLSKLCTSIFRHSSKHISPLLLSFLARYNLSTFPLRCRLIFIVINFLVLMSILFNFSFVQSNTPAPYLIITNAHGFIPAIKFSPCNCDLSSFFTLLMYSLSAWYFNSLCSNQLSPFKDHHHTLV